MDSVIYYVPTPRKPRRKELETCPRFGATLSAKWNPHDAKFEEGEIAMNGAYPRKQLDGVRTTVDTESDDMDLDSGDDTDSDDNSDELTESQETLGANLGEDLHLQWLQLLAQPRNISAIGIAEDGMLFDRMLRNRNISDRHLQDSTQGDRYTSNSNLQDEMNECYDTFETKDCEIERTINSIHLGETVRKVNAIHTPLQEKVTPNGTDISEIATTREVINISAVHRNYRGIKLPEDKAVSFGDKVSFKLPNQDVIWLGSNHGTIPLTDNSKKGDCPEGDSQP